MTIAVAVRCWACDGDGHGAEARGTCGRCGGGGLDPERFSAGDRVTVLRAVRLPKVEEPLGDGVIVRTAGTSSEPLYFVSGFPTARTAKQLRLVSRATA